MGNSSTRKRNSASSQSESNQEPGTKGHCYIPPNCNKHADRLTDERRKQRHKHADSPSSEIAATRQVSLSTQDIGVSTISCLVILWIGTGIFYVSALDFPISPSIIFLPFKEKEIVERIFNYFPPRENKRSFVP